MTKYAHKYAPMPKVSIVAVLNHYGANINEVPGNRRMKCIFHDDAHASATVNATTGYYACFACAISQDGIGLVMEREGLRFVEARQFCIEHFGEGNSTVQPAHRRSSRVSGKEGDNGGQLDFLSPGGRPRRPRAGA